MRAPMTMVDLNINVTEYQFRTAKSLFETRPIFHKLDETIRGHVSCSFHTQTASGGPSLRYRRRFAV
jgi:hypothetical protein